MNWYIVQAYSGFEKKVVDSIKEELKKHKLADNLQEILEDDKLTYKIIKGCVSINSAVTELIKTKTESSGTNRFILLS